MKKDEILYKIVIPSVASPYYFTVRRYIVSDVTSKGAWIRPVDSMEWTKRWITPKHKAHTACIEDVVASFKARSERYWQSLQRKRLFAQRKRQLARDLSKVFDTYHKNRIVLSDKHYDNDEGLYSVLVTVAKTKLPHTTSFGSLVVPRLSLRLAFSALSLQLSTYWYDISKVISAEYREKYAGAYEHPALYSLFDIFAISIHQRVQDMLSVTAEEDR